MSGGGSGAAAADTGARHIPASAKITARDDQARRRLHLRTGLTDRADFPARPRLQNHFIVRLPPIGYAASTLGRA
jgi:hypothetical protein